MLHIYLCIDRLIAKRQNSVNGMLKFLNMELEIPTINPVSVDFAPVTEWHLPSTISEVCC